MRRPRSLTPAKIRQVYRKTDSHSVASKQQLGVSSYENATPIWLQHNATGQNPGRRRHRLPRRLRSSCAATKHWPSSSSASCFDSTTSYSSSSCWPASTTTKKPAEVETTATCPATVLLFTTSWLTWTFNERPNGRSNTRYMRDLNQVGRLHILQESSSQQLGSNTRETMWNVLTVGAYTTISARLFFFCWLARFFS